MGEPLDLVDVVVRDQLARSGLRKIGQLILGADLALCKRQVQRLALFIPGEGRMRLIENSVPDMDIVFAVGDNPGIRISRQRAAALVEESWLGNLGSSRRNQLVRPLQVVTLQRRLVDLLNDVV